MESAMHLESAETLLKRYAKRNFWLNVLDGVAFVFGISMVSRYTVLPLFVSRLSSERWLRGLLPTLTQVGAPLPALYCEQPAEMAQATPISDGERQ